MLGLHSCCLYKAFFLSKDCKNSRICNMNFHERIDVPVPMQKLKVWERSAEVLLGIHREKSLLHRQFTRADIQEQLSHNKYPDTITTFQVTTLCRYCFRIIYSSLEIQQDMQSATVIIRIAFPFKSLVANKPSTTLTFYRQRAEANNFSLPQKRE